MTDGFDAELMVLSIPPRLGPFIAEHRTHIKKLVDRAYIHEPVFDKGTHDGSGPFWAQGDRPAAFILKGKHLFRDDIRGFPNAMVKKGGPFIDRGSDFSVIVFRG